MKVFALIEDYVFDFEREIKVTLYNSYDKAKSHLEAQLKREKKDSWLTSYLDSNGEFDDDIMVEKGKDCIDIYIDGRASEYETHLYIEEKEIY